MAWNLKEYAFSAPTAEDLSANQYQFVRLNSSGKVIACDQTHYPDGILLNQPSTGTAAAGSQYQASICYEGMTRLCVGGAYAVDTFLAPGVDGTNVGLGMTVTDGTSNRKFIRAQMKQASHAAYDIVTVQLLGPYPCIGATTGDATTNP